MRAACIVLAAALAACASPAPPADASGLHIGVVVLHGEGDDPYGRTLRLTRTLIRDGFLTDSPEMPWSARRAYDTGVSGAMKEIDASAVRLKSRGAKKIFVAGHGLGAAAAVGYATLRRVDGLIVLAPSSPGPAKAGAGSARTSARLEGEFSDAGPLSFGRTAAAVRPGTQVLWIVGGSEEPGLKKADQAAFEALPRNPPPQFVVVGGGHMDTPSAAAGLSADWMREIVKQ